MKVYVTTRFGTPIEVTTAETVGGLKKAVAKVKGVPDMAKWQAKLEGRDLTDDQPLEDGAYYTMSEPLKANR